MNKIKMVNIKPGMHKEIPMGTRVVVPKYYHNLGKDVIGTVSGISILHVIFHYIVILDEPLETDIGTINALSVLGTELVGLNGESWRLS